MDPDLQRELEEETERQPPPDALPRLQALAAEANELQEEIAILEQTISEKNARLRRILDRDMIDLLLESGVESVTVGGFIYSREEYCKASIKAEDATAEEAYNWLEDNNAGDLIKRDVIVSFPKEFQAEAEALANYTRTHYQMADVNVKRAVPWARLTSWVKEQRTAGETLPEGILGIKSGVYVSVTKPKEHGRVKRSKRR